MKTFLILPALAACLCAGVQAQTTLDTKAVTVTATVLNTCKFESGANVDLTLDNLDPSSGAAVTRTSSVKYRCTKGFAPTIKLVGSSGNPIDGTEGTSVNLTHTTSATASIQSTVKTSSLTSTAGEGFGSTNPLSLSLTAEFQPSQFQNALGGSYTGSLTIQLTP